MIKKFVFGKPFPTDAVTENIGVTDGKVPYFEYDDDREFTYRFSESDIVYGLGEQIRGINKRGWEYISWCSDNPHHHEDTRSLYGAHNFIIVRGANDLFGAFFDYAGKIVFDIGYKSRNLMKVRISGCDFTVYIITGTNEKDIVRQFRKIIGRSYIPPLWAFGYGQSRWGYRDENDIRTVAEEYIKAGIPVDSIYMDIDYMERYKDFTVDKGRFPNLQKLSDDMKSHGIRLVPIIDAGVKIEDGYSIYEEGKNGGYFCKDADGNDFVGAVWPGRVHFPDFLSSETRKWFGNKYKILTDQGIEGFWNDMNEPAIFYTEDRLANVLSRVNELSSGNMGINEYFEFTGTVAGLNGNEGDYDKFYHNAEGIKVRHSDVHNLYGMNMTRSAYEELQKIEPDRRILFFSRASYIGAHRYGGIWQGDNKSWWSHILQSMQQLPALNMSGFIFTGPDTGGFGCDTTEDLMLRWLQYTVFTPLFRNHSAIGTREQELYRFENVKAMREMIKIRYALIPYLYSEFLKAVLNDEMMFRPLSFDFTDDKDACGVEDQLLLGNEIMISPVYRQNAGGRYVYLPEEMMMIKMRRYDDYDQTVLPAGHHYIDVHSDELVFFIRKGKSLPWAEPAVCTDALDFDNITMLGYDNSRYILYKDNGKSPDPCDSLERIELQ